MREDVYIEEVISKCEAFKKATLWPSEQILKPRVWLNNFEERDKYIAAVLLNHFIFYNDQLTNYLFSSAYRSISDGYPKGPTAPNKDILINSVKSALFAPVEGEDPNPTDSGYIMCRRARQVLGISEQRIVNTSKALMHAAQGGTVVFIDDFIGSGDQFISTWEKTNPLLGNHSFSSLQPYTNFIAIYVVLVTTESGLAAIHNKAPNVAVCSTHTLNEDATYMKIGAGTQLQDSIVELLKKYSQLLTPREQYISNNPNWKAFGYKEKGLLFGFSHSIPDATLPIFWSPGKNNWEPLIERI